MKRGWNLGSKIGLVVGLLFAGLQWLAGQGGGIVESLVGAASIAIVFGIAGALVGGVWAAVFGQRQKGSQPSVVADIMTNGNVSRAADETGVVRWMFLLWFFVFIAAYGVIVAAVMIAIDPDPDRGVALLRGAGFPGLIVALVGAKLMTRKRDHKTPGPGEPERSPGT